MCHKVGGRDRMAENKTQKTTASVTDFINGIADESRRKDCRTVLKLMKDATGAPPRMWGSSIVGFGDFRYKYDSGREGDWFLAGFSPRKDSLTLYLVPGLHAHAARLKSLGTCKTGKSCLYIKRLSDVDQSVLKLLIADAVRAAKAFAARS
jgi:Domain of unknown function (DU1801)